MLRNFLRNMGYGCCMRASAWAIGRRVRCPGQGLELVYLGVDVAEWILACGLHFLPAGDEFEQYFVPKNEATEKADWY